MKHKIFFGIVVMAFVAQIVSGQIPQEISYQGLLTNASGTPVANGKYKLAFRIYDVETSGSPLWTETHTTVTVVNGIFNVILGNAGVPLNLPFDEPYWLGITVGNSAELMPRIKLTSAAYSLNSKSVSDGAITKDKLADNAVTASKIQPNVVSSVDGVSNDGGNVDLVSGNAITITPNDISNTITIGESHSSNTKNPHSVTATQVGALASVDGVSNAGGNIDLVAGSNVTITPNDATNTITISSTGGGGSGDYWGLTGNSGTTPGTNFLGTTDGQALEIKVCNSRIMRLEPSSISPNLLGGYNGNWITSGTCGAVISGGGKSGQSGTGARYENRVTDNYGTVGGGLGNQAGDDAGDDAIYATVSGGKNNIASRIGSTIPGGRENEANGEYSFAAGRRAKANHDGSFVWGDSTDVDVASTGNNQFIVRASGGIWFGTTNSPSIPAGRFINTSTGGHLTTGGTWTNGSDRAKKDNFTPVDGRDVLNRLADIPISTWNYKAEDTSTRHIGPMAQDFYGAFGMGQDDRHISTVDADGVALAAIQGLYEIVKEKDARIAELEARLAALEAVILEQKGD